VSLLFVKAYCYLILFDWYLARGRFHALSENVRNYARCLEVPSTDTAERACMAVNLACVWYWKEVRCLQRSAATVRLLKHSGVSAQLVIGAQQTPFKAHAWVEVDGQVVNDKPYLSEMYSILDRC
jgi:hypothetical protein